jgi:hypothetical protein
LLDPENSSAISRKVFLPRNTGINYIGLIIGPKGMYQKKLEEQTSCRILVRGKYANFLTSLYRGSHNESQPPQPDDNEEQHVLVSFCLN